MADYFLRWSDGDDASNGTTWALAFKTMAYALSQMLAGDTLYVADDHAETQTADMALTSPGTDDNWCFILCVDDTGDPVNPSTLATTAQVSTTGSGNKIGPFQGYAYVYGVKFQPANDAVNSGGANLSFNGLLGPYHWVFDNCVLDNGNTASTGDIDMGGTGNNRETSCITLIDTNVTMGNVNHQMVLEGTLFRWYGGTWTAATTAGCFKFASAQDNSDAVITGVDFSAVNKTLVDVSGIEGGRIHMSNCDFPATHTGITGTIAEDTNSEVLFVNCNDTDATVGYSLEGYKYGGSIIEETTIVRSGGASDGTTTISWMMTDNGSATFHSPFYSPWITGYLDSTGTKTFTLHFVHDNLTAIQDDEFWFELEYLDTANSPISEIDYSTRRNDILATPSNHDTAGSGWTTTGLTNPDQTTISATVEIAEIGAWRLRVALAKSTSYVVYVDPLIVIT